MVIWYSLKACGALAWDLMFGQLSRRRVDRETLASVYLTYRRHMRPMEAHKRAKAWMAGGRIDDLGATLLGVVTYVVVESLLHAHGGGGWLMWVRSPSGKTHIQLPLREAKRLMRKQGWCSVSWSQRLLAPLVTTRRLSYKQVEELVGAEGMN